MGSQSYWFADFRTMRKTESNHSFLDGPMIRREGFNKADLREPMVFIKPYQSLISGKIFTALGSSHTSSLSFGGWLDVYRDRPWSQGVRLAVQNFSQIFSTGFCLGGETLI